MKDGTIDAIATDHAPHHLDEKALEFDQAPFGITGLETAVGLAFDLVHAGLIDLERVVEMCATNPARIFGLTDRGSLKQNAHADITLLDPNLEWVFDVKQVKVEKPQHAFSWAPMQGAAVATIVGGRLVYLHPDYTRINEPKQRHVLATKSFTQGAKAQANEDNACILSSFVFLLNSN